MEGVAHRARFAALMTAITRRLPFGLSEVVAPSLVGYLLINLCTFFVDLGLLGLFHGTIRWPIPVAVTLSYGTASVISYVLNRVLNFRSHDAMGTRQQVAEATQPDAEPAAPDAAQAPGSQAPPETEPAATRSGRRGRRGQSLVSRPPGLR